MQVKEAKVIISNIETDIQSIQVLLNNGQLAEFYRETLNRTIHHLKLYKDDLLKAIEEADIS